MERYFINRTLKICSKSLRSLLDKCAEETKHEQDSVRFRETFRELYNTTEIVSMIKSSYLRFFGGYEAV